MIVWINIDIPTKVFGIYYENKSRNPKYKGINQMLRDGGWFEYESYQEAINLYKREYPSFKLLDNVRQY